MSKKLARKDRRKNFWAPAGDRPNQGGGGGGGGGGRGGGGGKHRERRTQEVNAPKTAGKDRILENHCEMRTNRSTQTGRGQEKGFCISKRKGGGGKKGRSFRSKAGNSRIKKGVERNFHLVGGG